LLQVSRKERDQEPPKGDSEERQVSDAGRLPCLRHQGISHKQGLIDHKLKLWLRTPLKTAAKTTPGEIWHSQVGAPASGINVCLNQCYLFAPIIDFEV